MKKQVRIIVLCNNNAREHYGAYLFQKGLGVVVCSTNVVQLQINQQKNQTKITSETFVT